MLPQMEENLLMHRTASWLGVFLCLELGGGLHGIPMNGSATVRDAQCRQSGLIAEGGTAHSMGVVMIEGLSPDQPTVTNDAGGKQSELLYRFDLLPPQALFALARVVAEGERKYGSDNWKKIPARQHLHHAIAHCFAFLAGDTQDAHLAHAACRIMFALEMACIGDDLPHC
ncbi:hypothetical protein FACS18948_3860 [Clostridia bacterium]|nr:hypothetical protein FACS18948_3860 [Clostridia bacterium]